ncbi:hypothetical protein FHG87_001500 [Trinorchestia longiramus]|nr:hypothetical protein FHG87_001500 [Trinorchestia longiramus]
MVVGVTRHAATVHKRRRRGHKPLLVPSLRAASESCHRRLIGFVLTGRGGHEHSRLQSAVQSGVQEHDWKDEQGQNCSSQMLLRRPAEGPSKNMEGKRDYDERDRDDDVLGLEMNRSRARGLDASYRSRVRGLDASHRSQIRGLDASYRSRAGGLDASYRSRAGGLDASYRSRVRALDASYRSRAGGLDVSYRSQIRGLDASYRSQIRGLDASYRSRVRALDVSYWSRAGGLNVSYWSRARGLDASYRSRTLPYRTYFTC